MKKASSKLTVLVLFACFFLVSGPVFAETSPPQRVPAVPTAAKGQKETPDAQEKSASDTSTRAGAGAGGDKIKEAPATTAMSTASARAPSTDKAPVDGAAYQVRLRDLEQRVDELKEQIRRSHTRLSLLSDTILAGASGGARAEIEFQNDLSSAWYVVEAVFVLDGAVQYKKSDDSGDLAKQQKIPIFSGTIPAGDHTLQVMLKLRGHGFGVFSYLQGIEAKVTSDHSFTLSEGKILELSATAWEQGGPTTPVEEQPAIRFQQTIKSPGGRSVATPQKANETKPPEKKTDSGSVSASGSGTK